MFYHSHPVTLMFAFALAAFAPIRGTLVPEARTLPAPSPRSVSLAALPTLVVEAKVDALHNSTLLDSSSTNKTRGALCPHNLDAPALDVAEADARALRHLTLELSLPKSTSLPEKTLGTYHDEVHHTPAPHPREMALVKYVSAEPEQPDARTHDATAVRTHPTPWLWLLHDFVKMDPPPPRAYRRTRRSLQFRRSQHLKDPKEPRRARASIVIAIVVTLGPLAVAAVAAIAVGAVAAPVVVIPAVVAVGAVAGGAAALLAAVAAAAVAFPIAIAGAVVVVAATAASTFSRRERTLSRRRRRESLRALAVAALAKGGLAGCAITPDSNGHVTISGTAIAVDAFRSCTALTSVTIGNSIIDINAFRYSALTSVTIGNSVMSINPYAFHGTNSLTSVCASPTVFALYNFPNGVNIECCAITPDSNGHVTISGTTIAYQAFGGCSALKSVTIGDSVTFIGVVAFASTALTSVTIPDSVGYIGSVRSSRPPPHSLRDPAG